jgi:hypothetical protein
VLQRLLAIAILVAAPAAALADEGPYAVGGGVRAGFGAGPSAEALDAYGYDRAMPLTSGIEVFAGYRITPAVEVGAVAGWDYRKLGSPPESTISMRSYTRALGGYLRPRLLGGGSAELGLRLEAGILASSVVLRGAEADHHAGYGRGRLELRLGGGRTAVVLHLEYRHVVGASRMSPVGTPGPELGAGFGLRYRLDGR